MSRPSRFAMLTLLLLAAMPVIAQDCKPEKYQVVNHVTINADRCDGVLQVKSLGTETTKNQQGKDLILTTYDFSHDHHTMTFIQARFALGGDIDVESILTSVGDSDKEDTLANLRKENPDWNVQKDTRQDWANGNSFPSRTITLELGSYYDKPSKHFTQPEFEVIQLIVDKHNNVAYILESHYWMSWLDDDKEWRGSMRVSWGQ